MGSLMLNASAREFNAILQVIPNSDNVKSITVAQDRVVIMLGTPIGNVQVDLNGPVRIDDACTEIRIPYIAHTITWGIARGQVNARLQPWVRFDPEDIVIDQVNHGSPIRPLNISKVTFENDLIRIDFH